jgi:drug/metabolite transporter (DMT)-like permease
MTISPRWALLAVFVGVTGHASSEFFAVLSGISGPEVSVWRYLLGGAGLVLWALLLPGSRDLLSPLRAEGWRLVWLSFVGVTLTYLAFHWSLDFATVIQVATITTTIPIWVAFANWAVNGVSPGAVKLATGALATLGIAALLTDGALAELAGETGTLFGVLLAMVCAALGSFYAVLVRPVMGRHGGLRIIALSMMLGGVGLWLLVGAAWGVWVNPAELFDRPPGPDSAGVNPGWWLLVLALWNTTITQLLWFGGLATAPDITRASYLFFLKPVIAALLAVAVLGQPLTALQVVAVAVVTGSVLVEILWPRLAGRRGAPARR